MAKIFSGKSPLDGVTELQTLKEPRVGFPIPMAPERVEEFAPGLDPDLQELADAFTEFKEKFGSKTNGSGRSKSEE